MVIDPDLDLVHGLARILRCKGYLVDEAVAANDSIDLAKQHCPRVVFLNYSLSDPGGSETRRGIQDVCPEAAFVLIVATEYELQEVRATGATAVRKPFELGSLLLALETLGYAQGCGTSVIACCNPPA